MTSFALSSSDGLDEGFCPGCGTFVGYSAVRCPSCDMFFAEADSEVDGPAYRPAAPSERMWLRWGPGVLAYLLAAVISFFCLIPLFLVATGGVIFSLLSGDDAAGGFGLIVSLLAIFIGSEVVFSFWLVKTLKWLAGVRRSFIEVLLVGLLVAPLSAFVHLILAQVLGRSAGLIVFSIVAAATIYLLQRIATFNIPLRVVAMLAPLSLLITLAPAYFTLVPVQSAFSDLQTQREAGPPQAVSAAMVDAAIDRAGYSVAAPYKKEDLPPAQQKKLILQAVKDEATARKVVTAWQPATAADTTKRAQALKLLADFRCVNTAAQKLGYRAGVDNPSPAQAKQMDRFLTCLLRAGESPLAPS